jgi:uncharacterized protein YqgC (DUF456 family)
LSEVVLWVIVLLLTLVGIAGSLLPILPGSPLIVVAALIYGFFTDFQEVTWTVILVLTGMTLLAQGVDWLASAYGAKRRKASAWGVLGGVVGGILGFLTAGLTGLLLGVFLLSFLAEWILGGRDVSDSMGVGWASLIGFLGGTLLKFLLSLIMAGILLYAALS